MSFVPDFSNLDIDTFILQCLFFSQMIHLIVSPIHLLIMSVVERYASCGTEIFSQCLYILGICIICLPQMNIT